MPSVPVQLGTVKLVLCGHLMHLSCMHPVTSENQFHSTRLYTALTLAYRKCRKGAGHLAVSIFHKHDIARQMWPNRQRLPSYIIMGRRCKKSLIVVGEHSSLRKGKKIAKRFPHSKMCAKNSNSGIKKTRTSGDNQVG